MTFKSCILLPQPEINDENPNMPPNTLFIIFEMGEEVIEIVHFLALFSYGLKLLYDSV